MIFYSFKFFHKTAQYYTDLNLLSDAKTGLLRTCKLRLHHCMETESWFPVHSGGRSYRKHTILALHMISRFWYSFTSHATTPWDTSCHKAGILACQIQYYPRCSVPFRRQFPALSVFYPRADSQVGQTGNVWNHLPKPEMTTGYLLYNDHWGNWNRYVQRGQRALNRTQIFHLSFPPWCHQWRRTTAG